MTPLVKNDAPLTGSRYHSLLEFLAVLSTAVITVFAIAERTNRFAPKWDTAYYVDMATNGIFRNHQLAAPFAYRPAAPLLVHTLSHLVRTDPGATFRLCDALMCVVFILSSYYFARFLGARFRSAWLASFLVALYFFIVKWTLFSGTMVDIYAYPLILLAFVALLRQRFYICLLICAIGLFFKEFLLLPLLTQGIVLTLRRRQIGLKKLIRPLSLTVFVLLVCFLAPRLLIHVVSTFQDIDPINNPSSLRLLIAYPANIKRDFNISFYYVACWLPVLLLLNAERSRLIWDRVRPYRLLLAVYLTLHFLLVMYGGTNLDVFVSYALPVELMVLTIILDAGEVRPWEKILTATVVAAFNRLWMYLPLPDQNLNAYLNFYGGYHTEVTWRSFARMAELLAWILTFHLLRVWSTRRRRILREC